MGRFRLGLVDQRLIDWGLAVALAGLAELQLLVDQDQRVRDGFAPALPPLILLETLPIAWRRQHPWPVLAVTGLAAAGQVLLHSPVNQVARLAVLVAYYTVAATADRRLVQTLMIATPVGIVAAKLTDPMLESDVLMLIYAEFMLAWALGEGSRHLRIRAAALEQRAAAAVEREKQLLARAAAADERARIAGELHDVVAHSLSVISLQAAAARSVLESSRDRARECLRSIETVSREAWTDMRGFLVVGSPDAAGAADVADAPDAVDGATLYTAGAARPGLARLADLVGRFEAAGLCVDLAVRGHAQPLPAPADLCAYRIVQEALTNALRHTGAGRACVRIDYDRMCVQLEITNDGAAKGAKRVDMASEPSGYGLSGMRDRVSRLGGDVAITHDGDRFTVQARLPVPAVTP
jgi:signal transduction histidine kinase